MTTQKTKKAGICWPFLFYESCIYVNIQKLDINIKTRNNWPQHNLQECEALSVRQNQHAGLSAQTDKAVEQKDQQGKILSR